ncbi:hypothetical protein [Telmatospirillum siberiense]|uniref:hypothetical protein n=1 Tax=Telmatospirillum siberiense TaxID=382514 RepID=UPI0011AF6399|nr:hypothetical protein [Telmatospirillum siberiense]
MSTRARLWALIVGLLVIVAAYFVLTRPSSKNQAGQPQPSAVQSDRAEQKPAVSGNYSDDWMKTCGPIQGAAQKDCTARLGAAYGLVDGAPVPADPKGAGK